MDDWGQIGEQGSLGAKNNTVTASFTMGEAGRPLQLVVLWFDLCLPFSDLFYSFIL